MVIADPAIRDEIVKRGVRESMRRTGLSQHTIEAICGGKAVRPATLLRVVQSQHTFDFLRGDPGKNGECRKLPVDAYYEQLKLVVEYRERQHTEAVPFFDRKATLSGCGRGEQRRRYDQRRRDVLREQGIPLIEIEYADFQHRGNKRLIRSKNTDEAVIREKLASFLVSGK